MYDLHTHSRFSDGTLTPTELVSRAKQRGVSTIALTDHDTLAGIRELETAAQAQDLHWVSGIEFSCLWNGISVHVVGLNFNPDHPIMVEAVERQAQARESRALTIAERLEKRGIADALQGALEEAGDAHIGRPHFAKFLVKNGYCKSMNAAFKKYLGPGKPGDVKQLWPEVELAIEWILQAGGVAVLAHPNKYQLTRTKLKRLLVAFAEAGGQAMEVISGQQKQSDGESLALLAEEFGLLASCGSDFHVPGAAWQELGSHGPLPDRCTPIWHQFV